METTAALAALANEDLTGFTSAELVAAVDELVKWADAEGGDDPGLDNDIADALADIDAILEERDV